MKKLIPIFLALLIGAILALPVLKIDFQKLEKKEISELYVLQTGVFTSLNNAIEEQKKISNSIIYKDQDQYRVLVGASSSEYGLEKIEHILQEEEIHYYKKKLSITDQNEFLLKYNLMLEKTNDKDSIKLLNQKILEKMMEL